MKQIELTAAEISLLLQALYVAMCVCPAYAKAHALLVSKTGME